MNQVLIDMARSALESEGCDCGTDDGPCLACACDIALEEQEKEIKRLKSEREELFRALVRAIDMGRCWCSIPCEPECWRSDAIAAIRKARGEG